MTTSLTNFTRIRREARREQLGSMHLAVRKQAMLHLDEVKQAFDLLSPALRKTAWISPERSQIAIGATPRHLRSFKDPRLVRQIGKLLDAGFTAERTQDWAHEHEPERDYAFSRYLGLDAEARLAALLPKATREYFEKHYVYGIKDPLTLRVTLFAYVKESSPTCRSVVVRTERREVLDVIREIVCA